MSYHKIIYTILIAIGLGACIMLFSLVSKNLYPEHGFAASLTNFDEATQEILKETIQARSSTRVEFKSATMVQGKDHSLYLNFTLPTVNPADVPGLFSFAMQKCSEHRVELISPGVPWWDIPPNKVKAAFCSTAGYTTIILVKGDRGFIIFMVTDGNFIRPDGSRTSFDGRLFSLFKK